MAEICDQDALLKRAQPRISNHIPAVIKCPLWVKLVGLAMTIASQLTAWKQANFEIYRREAKDRDRSPN